MRDTTNPLSFTGGNTTRHDLDEFALYGRALSAEEVLEHHEAGEGAETEQPIE